MNADRAELITPSRAMDLYEAWFYADFYNHPFIARYELPPNGRLFQCGTYDYAIFDLRTGRVVEEHGNSLPLIVAFIQPTKGTT